jgi:ATP-dependent DNA helicase RecG
LFDDRLEITSAGGLPEGLSKDEFFEGFSVPRNKEIMRIYKDLNLVEHLGSGVPRILESYAKDCFTFSENFLRMTFPSAISISDLVAHDSVDTSEKFTEVKKQFGSISDRLRLGKEKNTAFLQTNYGAITEELQEKYGRNTEEVRKKYGRNAMNIMLLFLIEPTIITKDIATILGISSSTIEKAIAKLKEENIIQREGATKVGSWKIIVK